MDKMTSFMIVLPIVLISIAIHEFAHAKIADMSGDPTPRNQGRVTLNPLVHLDPIGTIMIILSSLSGYGIGWGRPVQVDPRKMRNPRWDDMLCALGGPVSNFLQATVYAIVLRVLLMGGMIGPDSVVTFALGAGVIINLGLCFFNLIPIGPLDGHWILGAFLPAPQRLAWFRFNRGPGALIFLILVLVPSGSGFDILGTIYWPFVKATASFLLGR